MGCQWQSPLPFPGGILSALEHPQTTGASSEPGAHPCQPLTGSPVLWALGEGPRSSRRGRTGRAPHAGRLGPSQLPTVAASPSAPRAVGQELTEPYPRRRGDGETEAPPGHVLCRYHRRQVLPLCPGPGTTCGWASVAGSALTSRSRAACAHCPGQSPVLLAWTPSRGRGAEPRGPLPARSLPPAPHVGGRGAGVGRRHPGVRAEASG